MEGIAREVKNYIQEQTQKADLISAKMRRFGWSMGHLTNEDYDIWRRYRTYEPTTGGIREQIENCHIHNYERLTREEIIKWENYLMWEELLIKT